MTRGSSIEESANIPMETKIFSVLYCADNSQYDREGCYRILKLSKSSNPSYLEQWISSQGTRFFRRTDLILFSYYVLPYEYTFRGEPSASVGFLVYIGVLNNFIPISGIPFGIVALFILPIAISFLVYRAIFVRPVG